MLIRDLIRRLKASVTAQPDRQRIRLLISRDELDGLMACLRRANTAELRLGRAHHRPVAIAVPVFFPVPILINVPSEPMNDHDLEQLDWVHLVQQQNQQRHVMRGRV